MSEGVRGRQKYVIKSWVKRKLSVMNKMGYQIRILSAIICHKSIFAFNYFVPVSNIGPPHMLCVGGVLLDVAEVFGVKANVRVGCTRLHICFPVVSVVSNENVPEQPPVTSTS